MERFLIFATRIISDAGKGTDMYRHCLEVNIPSVFRLILYPLNPCPNAFSSLNDMTMSR